MSCGLQDTAAQHHGRSRGRLGKGLRAPVETEYIRAMVRRIAKLLPPGPAEHCSTTACDQARWVWNQVNATGAPQHDEIMHNPDTPGETGAKRFGEGESAAKQRVGTTTIRTGVMDLKPETAP